MMLSTAAKEPEESDEVPEVSDEVQRPASA
jgi:hypothetical protein